MIKPQELKERLDKCYGTQHYYRLYKEFYFTDGAKTFFDSAEAYWLLSDLFFMTLSLIKRESFIFIQLEVKNDAADLTLTDGNDKVLLKQHYSYTDCPEGIWEMFLVTQNEQSVLMIPSEY